MGSLASSSLPLQEMQAEAQEAEAQAEEMEAEAEAEAEAEVGELEAEVDAEAEAEAEAAGAKAEARTLTKAASTFGERLAKAKENVELEATEAPAPTLDASGEPTLDVPTLTRPAGQEAELAKLDASVARDVQAELSKMDAQDVQSELAAKKFAQAVALDSQQAQGQQAAQALEAAIGKRPFAERQRAVLVAEGTEGGAMRAKSRQVGDDGKSCDPGAIL